MAYVGAFGTGQLPFLPRLAYWLILMESGALIGIGASTGVRTWGRLASRPTIEGLVVSLMIALPLTLVASGTTVLFFGSKSFDISAVGVLFVGVFVITAAVTAIVYLTGRDEPNTFADARMTTDNPVRAHAIAGEEVASALPDLGSTLSRSPPRISGRLSPHLRSTDILALESEDHYVRVHTGNGSELILMRLGDAVEELDGLAGERTHRSWWVARQAVTSFRKGEGRAELTLSGGIVAPVSRSALSTLRERGWFTDARAN